MHKHSHLNEQLRVPPKIRRLLVVLVVPFAVITAIGLAVLWPGDVPSEVARGVEFPSNLVNATVTAVEKVVCPGTEDLPEVQTCERGLAKLTEGKGRGRVVGFDLSATSGTELSPGSKVVLGELEDAPPQDQYYYVDRQRALPMALLAAIFAVVVIALGRWKGLAALAGFTISLLVLILFVLPAILAGSDPVAVSIVGSAVIMFVGLYTAHGVNVPTTTALIGTLLSFLITALFALVFVKLTHLTGFTSEEAIFVNVAASGSINLRGLVLAGIVIGSLGVLDDVTVTQASAVWELRRSNPLLTRLELYRSAIRIGRDHIASTVNTLVLAYAGASLPLLILFNIGGAHLGEVITGEIVAEEIVRTLIGSIGLVASVPITTGIASAIATAWKPPSSQDLSGAAL